MSSNRPRYHSDKPPNPAKNIMVFCDGTGKDGASGKEEPTNVWQLYQLMKEANLRSSTAEDTEEYLLYIAGVGSGSLKNPGNLLSRLFGIGIVDLIVEAYLHIARKYRQGDLIYLFGYSRGAFVARKVACLIFRIGLVPNRERFLERWQQLEKPVPWKTAVLTKSEVPIHCLAVWDTVGAIYYKPISRVHDGILGMPDEELPPNITHAFHIVAFHENRRLFSVTLFKPNGLTQLREIWFPGAHSDVGGGGSQDTELPKLSLIWLMGELEDIIDIPDDRIVYPNIERLQPMNAYDDSPLWKRLADRCQTRLQSNALCPHSPVHETVATIKKTLDPRLSSSPRMLSIDDLQFINWNIGACLVSCNAFEIYKRTGVSPRKSARTARKTEARKAKARADPEEVRHVAAWARYNDRWAQLRHSSSEYGDNVEDIRFRFEDIPWPMVTCPSSPARITKEEIEDFLLSRHSGQRKPPKTMFKECLLAWHPDKFVGRWMESVIPADKDHVTEGVSTVTRAAKELMAEYTDDPEAQDAVTS